MAHSNAPLTPEGRRRLIDRIEEGRPISHVADEAGVSRKRLGIWYRRWQKEGDAGLDDHSSRPLRSPNLLPEAIGNRIEQLRREQKWGPDRISGFMAINEEAIVSPAHRLPGTVPAWPQPPSQHRPAVRLRHARTAPAL